MFVKLTQALFFILLLPKWIENARILAMLPTPSWSHNIVYHPVLRELSLRGHQVVSIIPDLMNDTSLTNLTEIDVSFSYEIWHRFNKFTKERLEGYSPIQSMYGMSQGLLELCDRELDHPEVKKIIQDPNEHFDLVINEWLLFPSTFAFATRFNCPVVGISSFGLNGHGHDSIGNPHHPAYNPDFYLPYSHELTFWQRVYSTIYAVWYRFYFHFKLLPQHDAIAKKHFGNDFPYLTDALKRITVVLISENPVYTGAKPRVPALIDISGLHFKEPKPLPKDLQEMLDNAKQGFIYFSLGTNLKSKNLPQNKFNALMETFRELPYLVLWKFELDNLENKPDNVIVRKWLPQQDILSHPNLKLYLMQGGLQSTEESIQKKVPMIAIPFFADQEINAARYIYHGIGDRLGFDELDDKNIIKAKINNIIDDKRYKERITELSELMWDTPMPSLDRAVWWIEFVLRHKGLPKLRSPTADMSWIQLLLIDVISFFLSCAIVGILILYYSFKFVCKLCSKNRKVSTKKVKRN